MVATTYEIIGLTCNQMNANMQKHMRGYDNSAIAYAPEEKPNPDMKDFAFFVRSAMCSLYKEFPPKFFISNYEKHKNNIANYFRTINDEILSSDEFTNAIVNNQKLIKNIGGTEFYINRHRKNEFCVDDFIKVTALVSFIPSIDDKTQNKIRIDITEYLEKDKVNGGKKYLTGSIDIDENGELIINPFTVDSLKYQCEIIGNSIELLKDKNGNLQYTKETKDASVEDTHIENDQLEIVRQFFTETLGQLYKYEPKTIKR